MTLKQKKRTDFFFTGDLDRQYERMKLEAKMPKVKVTHITPWLPNTTCMAKLPLVKALAPLGEDLPQELYTDLANEAIACMGEVALRETGQLTKEIIERKLKAVEAASKAVSKVYRTATRKVHPDHHGDAHLKEYEQLQIAKKVLGDDVHRRDYVDQIMNLFNFLHKKKKMGEKIQPEFEQKLISDAHKHWLDSNKKVLDDDDLNTVIPKKKQKHLQITGGIFSRIPKQVQIRQRSPEEKKVVVDLPAIKPSDQFYAYCHEVQIVVLDGAKEILLSSMDRKVILETESRGVITKSIEFPENGLWNVCWRAVMQHIQADDKVVRTVTPLSDDCIVDLLLPEQTRLLEMKPSLIVMAKRLAGEFRAYLDKLNTTATNDVKELELNFWKLHQYVARSRAIQRQIAQAFDVLGDRVEECSEHQLLFQLIGSASERKEEIGLSLQAKHLKKERSAFKCMVAARLESGDAASWMSSMTLKELSAIGGDENRLFQLLVDGKRAQSLLVDPDTFKAASLRLDLFTEKQTDKLLECFHEAETCFAEEAERARLEEEEQKQQEEVRKKLEEKANEIRWGTTVILIGLKQNQKLNGTLGAYRGRVEETNRYRIFLLKEEREVSLQKTNFMAYHDFVARKHSEENISQIELQAPEGAVCDVNNEIESISVDNSSAIEEKVSVEDACFTELSVQIPVDYIGVIVGKKEGKLGKLRKRTGVEEIRIEKEEVNGMREIHFKGSLESIGKAQAHCEKSVANFINSEQENCPSIQQYNLPHSVKIKSLQEDDEKAPFWQISLEVPSDRLSKRSKTIGPSLLDITNICHVIMINILELPGRDNNEVQVIGKGNSVLKAVNLFFQRFVGTRTLLTSKDSEIVPYRTDDISKYALNINELAIVSMPFCKRFRRQYFQGNSQSVLYVPKEKVQDLLHNNDSLVQRILDSSSGLAMISVSKEPRNGRNVITIVGESEAVIKAESVLSLELSLGEKSDTNDDQSEESSSDETDNENNIYPLESVLRFQNSSPPDESVPISRRQKQVLDNLVEDLIGPDGVYMKQLVQITGVNQITLDNKIVQGMREVCCEGCDASVCRAMAIIEEFCSGFVASQDEALLRDNASQEEVTLQESAEDEVLSNTSTQVETVQKDKLSPETVKEEILLREPLQDEIHPETSSREETPVEESSQDEVLPNTAKQEETPQDDAFPETSLQEMKTPRESSQDGSPQEDKQDKVLLSEPSRDELLPKNANDASRDEALLKEISHDEGLPTEPPQDENVQDDLRPDDVAQAEAFPNEALQEQMSQLETIEASQDENLQNATGNVDVSHNEAPSKTAMQSETSQPATVVSVQNNGFEALEANEAATSHVENQICNDSSAQQNEKSIPTAIPTTAHVESQDSNASSVREDERSIPTAVAAKSHVENQNRNACSVREHERSIPTAVPATDSAAHLPLAIGDYHSSNDPLYDFLCTQKNCLKCSVNDFLDFLQSQDIESLSDLLEAVSDKDFLQLDMQQNGLKGFKKYAFQKAAVAAASNLFKLG